MLARNEVIDGFLQMFHRPSYLEIGVNHGETFFKVDARRKVAVDPRFLFDVEAAKTLPGVELHQVASDIYFGEIAQTDEMFDVIYLDGLHTFEQTLRDLLNAVGLLKRGGVIVIDDVIPNSFDASLPDLDEVFKLRRISPELGADWHQDGSWMGDVFKVPFFIQSFMQQYSYATVLENHGQTVMWQRKRPSAEVKLRSMEQLARYDYRQTILGREDFAIRPYQDILAEVRAANGGGSGAKALDPE